MLAREYSAMNIVITGATRGLGHALTNQFIALGHTVAGCGRNEAGVRALQRAHPAPHDFAALDVTQAEAVEAWAARVMKKLGAPDLLINNAALMNNPAPLWKVPAAEFSALMDVNLKGVANVIRAFVPAMVERRRGVIVNFSSGWGRSVDRNVAPYCATKWAIEGLTKALAEELPDGMAAVPLNPGVINTDMLQQCWPDGAAAFPQAAAWAKKAAPFILGLGPQHNGDSVSVREFEA
jgi:NAD(P)-dependent dehydrogenase (short-subunit alcohol dehydrogenase family)